jgi:hypothetical protein
MVNIADFRILKTMGMNHFPEEMPEWAQELTLRVCERFGVDIPEIKWATKDRTYSTGRAFSSEEKNERRYSYDISIVAGTYKVDTKLVLLHELAHFTNPPGEHHGNGFWIRAFDLYEAYGIPVMFAHNRERKYRANAEEIGWERVFKKFGHL